MFVDRGPLNHHKQTAIYVNMVLLKKKFIVIVIKKNFCLIHKISNQAFECSKKNKDQSSLLPQNYLPTGTTSKSYEIYW